MHEIVAADFPSDKPFFPDLVFDDLFLHPQDLSDLVGGEDRRV
jgi:hypothetical protein